MVLERVPLEVGSIHTEKGITMGIREPGVRFHGSGVRLHDMIKIIMQYIDTYCQKIYYIVSSYTSHVTSENLKRDIRTDLLKTMTIGATLGILLRFCTYKRHYQLKHYAKSLVGGSVFGAGYYPFFMV